MIGFEAVTELSTLASTVPSSLLLCDVIRIMAGSRTFTFLGTGTSTGVPMVGCDCEVCQSTDPRNQRYRCAVLIGTPRGNVLIDTPPELRLQLLRERVSLVHAVLFTHYHAD